MVEGIVGLMNKSKRNGFTLIEALVALMVSMVVSLLCLLLFQVQFHLIQLPQTTQEQLAILQIRQMLACADVWEVKQERCVYEYNHETIEIGFDKNRLVKQEGYQILMENIDDASFFEKQESLYLSFSKAEKVYTFQIN